MSFIFPCIAKEDVISLFADAYIWSIDMSVLIITSLGNLVVDLHTDLCPLASKNFLKLCKIKYYNNCLFHTVQKDFIVQAGDPTGTGSGGDSIYKFLYGDQARFFDDEIHPKIKHDKVGILAMASAGENLNASQFYITTRAELDYLDEKHTVFGEVAEGHDTLMRINEAFVDDKGRPYKNIRVKHTYVLDDPFDDPAQLAELIPEKSPVLRTQMEGDDVRLEDDWVPMDEKQDPEELDKSLRSKEAHSRAVVLEMIGDIPEAEIKPPENVLFVCKLNPVTQEEDLEIIFSRFGKIISADIIKDYKTGDSLCYGFIEFETREACETAYFKMDNVLIDDRRIHVDFSQSVAKLWTRFRRFGTKDTSVQGSGCFKCGETGHHANDCPNNSAKEKDTSQQRPKFVLKDTSTQYGDVKYEMVFEQDDDNFQDRGKDRGIEKYRIFEGDRKKATSKRLRGSEDTANDRNAYRSSYSSKEARGYDLNDRRHAIEENRYDSLKRNERHDRKKELDSDFQNQRRKHEERRGSQNRNHGQEKPKELEDRHSFGDEYKKDHSCNSYKDYERRHRKRDSLHNIEKSRHDGDAQRNKSYIKHHRD